MLFLFSGTTHSRWKEGSQDPKSRIGRGLRARVFSTRDNVNFKAAKRGKERQMEKIFSFDAETDGLWGKAFAISAIVYEDGRETARFLARLPDSAVTNGWVKENVLPKLADVAVTHESFEAMLADFAAFYKANKSDAAIVVHMGTPVEFTVLKQMHELGMIGDWDGPFPLHDLVGYLASKGEDPTSVDKYNAKHGLMDGRSEAAGMESHHPLYDSIAAAVAYMHLTQ
jgi:hypothetical protein